VRRVDKYTLAFWAAALLAAGCETNPAPIASVTHARAPAPAPGATVIRIEASPRAPKLAQAAMINAKPGDVIEFGPGRFEFRSTLSLDVSGVTVRGQGPDKTILNFKEQGAGTGGEGVLITSKENVTLEDFAIEDARGDAVKAQGTKKIAFRNIRALWTGGPKETNGGYGIYPVSCASVLIEGCTSIGASDAGIYVGQSEDIIVRNNKAEKNVAGIEIENSVRADVYGNLATDNSGGILVFALPDLPIKEGRHCRVYNNTLRGNNHPNFAPKGNIVATVPPGTGMMIMANDQVEVFNNTIEQNQTTGLAIVSYMITGLAIKDEKYDPFCESIHIHDNRFISNGGAPGGILGGLLGMLLGTPLPDILYDGALDPRKLAGGKLPAELALHIHDNEGARFANFDGSHLPAAGATSGDAMKVDRDLKPHTGSLPALEPVSIKGLK
jgi:parallel beta-helix repeat protein